LPPWYLSWPAYIFYGLLLFFVIYLADRIQRRRLIAKERHRAMQRELEQAKEIEKSYHELKVAQDQLIQSERMASLGELAAGIAHEIQNPLNFVNNFSEVSADLIREMNEEIDKGNTVEVKEIAADLTQNLEIISQHGKRASSIVKGMLEHSRTSKGEKRPVDINALADEFLRLSYHGLRAKDKSFNADFKTYFDPNLTKVEVIPQDIGRVLLNLINNAFYACAERSRSAVSEKNLTGFKNLSGLDEYKPTVTITTKNLGDKIEISIKDNGSGIPEEIKNKIFQPFFTTKPTGEGTGLGLSLSYDIITKGHGGELLVETKPGEGTAFIIQIPIK
jgi:signal transduction histidine kinase